MMTIINCFSLLSIFACMAVLIFTPKIKLPLHVDVIMFFIAICAAALFINTVLGQDLYGHFRATEISFRLAVALLLIRFVYQSYRDAYCEQ